MSENVGLASARGLCDAMRKAGIKGNWSEPEPKCYEYFLDARYEDGVCVSLTYNERMDINDWEKLSPNHRREVPLRHQPREVRLLRTSSRDPEDHEGRSPK